MAILAPQSPPSEQTTKNSKKAVGQKPSLSIATGGLQAHLAALFYAQYFSHSVCLWAQRKKVRKKSPKMGVPSGRFFTIFFVFFLFWTHRLAHLG